MNVLFLGLIVPMFAFTGCYMAYIGMFKGEIRNALNSLLKALLALGIGIIFIVHPQLVNAPNTIANFGQLAVYESLGDSFQSKKDDDLCKIEKDIKKDKDFLKNTNNELKSVIACRMWSEFLYKPFIVGQFGTEYNKLKDLKNVNKEWVGELKTQIGKTEYKDLGIFYLSVMSGMHDNLDGIESPLVHKVGKDYYRIIDTLSNYNEKVIEVDLGDSVNSSGNINITSRSGSLRNIPKVQNFLNKYMKDAIEVAQEYKIPASVMLAQMAAESDYGTKAPNNNFFGVKCNSRVKKCSNQVTKEDYGRGQQTVTQSFAVYDTPKDSMIDYAKTITSPTYSNARNANNWAEFISAIAPKYATAKNYASFISSILVGMGLEDLDKDYNKALVDFGAINSRASSDSNFSGIHSYVEVEDTEPLKEWNFFIGNRNGNRVAYALAIFVFSSIGSIVPLTIALTNVIYTIGLTILIIFLPMFLLLGCYPSTQHIFMKYVKTLFSTILKKIALSFFLIISLILITMSMSLINSLGYFQAILIVVILTFVILRNKKIVLNKIGEETGLNNEKFKQTINKAKNVFKTGTQMVGMGAYASRKAKKENLDSFDAFKMGAGQVLENKAYQSRSGRIMLNTYNKNKNNHNHNKENKEMKYCAYCGSEILENELSYLDDFNNLVCNDCALGMDNDRLIEN